LSHSIFDDELLKRYRANVKNRLEPLPLSQTFLRNKKGRGGNVKVSS